MATAKAAVVRCRQPLRSTSVLQRDTSFADPSARWLRLRPTDHLDQRKSARVPGSGSSNQWLLRHDVPSITAADERRRV